MSHSKPCRSCKELKAKVKALRVKIAMIETCNDMGEAMDAGYAQGAENTEARAGMRIGQLEDALKAVSTAAKHGRLGTREVALCRAALKRNNL